MNARLRKSNDEMITIQRSPTPCAIRTKISLRSRHCCDMMATCSDQRRISLSDQLQAAVGLHRQGQLTRAQRIYEDILQAQPRHFDALHLLGIIAAVTGNPQCAVDLFRRALEIDPDNAYAHNNLGTALQELGQWGEALASLDRAAALKTDYAEPFYNRGNVFRHTKRWQEAVANYDQAIGRKSDYAEAYCNRGIALAELKQFEAALSSYDCALAIKHDYAEAYYNRGIVLCSGGQWEAALQSYDRAIMLKSDYAEAYANRAFALQELDRTDEAVASCNQAVTVKPDCAEAHCNRGSVLHTTRRLEEALAGYDKAISIKPDYATAHVNRAMALLLMGDYQKGWTDYEWRGKEENTWTVTEKRNLSQPLWLGQVSLEGKSILLQSEQGYGDIIQFCRYAELAADLGARVILEVPQALAGLLQGLKGVAELIVQGEPLPPFDYYCPLMSLPLAMNTRLSAVPAKIPYLSAGDDRSRRWRQKLGERTRTRVGLVWGSGVRPNPRLSSNSRRNIALAKLAPLKHPDIEFYSLQKGQPAESELEALIASNWDGPEIKDFTGDIRDFEDTAALIEQLDLVISVDTSTAHLAGASGKPVWILLRFDACWRWLLDRSDSPWYPTARLYRQERTGDWDPVVQRVRVDLEQFSMRVYPRR
jgi:tetratricopeptide (TPR) repeat protein